MTHVTRIALLALLAGCAAAGGARLAPPPEAASQAAAVHHELKVQLYPSEHRLEVEDTLTLSVEERARLGTRPLVFTLHAGLAPERVGPGAPVVARGPVAGPVMQESFAVSLGDGESRFVVRYGGSVFHPLREHGEEYARREASSPGLVSPEGVVLAGSTRWVPHLGDGLVTFTLEATVPPGWDAVSQGARARHEKGAESTVVRWESPEPQDEVFLIAARFVERSRRSGPVLLQTFLRADEPALAEQYLATGAQYLAMYEELLGRYPYAKFALVENFWETGYGMPSFTLLGPKIIRFPFILHSSYPHELLHNWWGNGVFVDWERGNWSEGLTAYLADHLIREQRGEGAEHRRGALRNYADYVATQRDFPVREFRARHSSVTQAVGYDKVLLVFHMLRQRLGDATFIAGLRRFYETHRFRFAAFDDLQRAMSEAAGEDLAPFFAQWIDRAGAPALRLDGAERRPRDGGWVVELSLTQAQAEPVFELDVPVYLTVDKRQVATRRTVRMSERSQRFTIELEEAPLRVDVDVEFDVFRRLDPQELPPTLGGAFGAERTLLVLPAAAPAPLRAAYRALAESWRAPGTEIVADEALSRLPAGAAVWVFGWENRLVEEIREGLLRHEGQLSGDALRAGPAALSRRDHSIVATLRNPADAARVLVFVGASDARAVPGLGRKLPHYGRYSLLGFEGEEPTLLVKHTWPVLASPLTGPLAEGALPPRAELPRRPPLAVLPPPR